MNVFLFRRSLAACALLVCTAGAVAKEEPACVISRQGVPEVQLGETFKSFKQNHPKRFRVSADPETMNKFLMLYDSEQANGADPKGEPTFLVFFDDFGWDDNLEQDMQRLAPPKDRQKVDRIEVKKKTCRTAEGLFPGMLVKNAAKQYGGIRQIEGVPGFGEMLYFVNPPSGFGFFMEGAISKPSPDEETWTTQRYRSDAKITSIVITP